MLTAKDYQTALDVQSACNLSGVIHSFNNIMEKICEDIKGTDDRNNHAICRLFAEQIMFLTSNRDYMDAYNECEQKARRFKRRSNTNC
jgi:hypothetical protein